jgi:hypothetical protein
MRRSVLVGSTLALGLTTFLVTREIVANASTELKAFTARVHEVHYGSSGRVGRDETYTVAFRADGSSVKDSRRQLAVGRGYEIRSVTDVAGLRRMVVDYATNSTTTYGLLPSYAATLRNAASSCDTKPVEEATILGYAVVHTTTVHTFPGINPESAVKLERWEAPALNCFALREVVTFGTRGAHNETTVLSVIPGEPDPTLFSVPSDFIERAPSPRHVEFQRRFGVNPPDPPAADAAYFSNRPQ